MCKKTFTPKHVTVVVRWTRPEHPQSVYGSRSGTPWLVNSLGWRTSSNRPLTENSQCCDAELPSTSSASWTPSSQNSTAHHVSKGQRAWFLGVLQAYACLGWHAWSVYESARYDEACAKNDGRVSSAAPRIMPAGSAAAIRRLGAEHQRLFGEGLKPSALPLPKTTHGACTRRANQGAAIGVAETCSAGSTPPCRLPLVPHVRPL